MIIYESLILLICSIILLRVAGKKSIAQMSTLETVIVLAMGTTMGHAIKENKLWDTIFVLFVFVLFLVIVQKLQLRFNILERYLIGEATLVIYEGKIVTKNLEKLRMTKDQLEMKLRKNGISYISDVKIGTIEIDGGFGYELMPHVKPITQEELLIILDKQNENHNFQTKGENIFDQVVKNNKG